MLEEEKEIFIDTFGNPKTLKWVSILLVLFLSGAFYSYFTLETAIEEKQLVDVYAKHPKRVKGSKTSPSYLTFESTSHEEITFRVETQYLNGYDISYLFSFTKPNKLYKLKVLKTDLDHAQKGDKVNLYSILDEKTILDKKKNYLTFEEYNQKNKMNKLEWFNTCTLMSTFLFVWMIILIIRKMRITAVTVAQPLPKSK